MILEIVVLHYTRQSSPAIYLLSPPPKHTFHAYIRLTSQGRKRYMKGITDMFCTSDNSSSIIMTSNMEFLSAASSSTSSSCSFTPGGRAIDRYNPIITDDKRRGSISASARTTPCTDTHPINPTHQNKPSSDRRKNRKLPKQTPTVDGVEKSVSKPSDWMMKAAASTIARPGTEYISPPESSRYLLDESSFIDVLSDFDPVSKSAQKKADEVDVLVDPNPKLDDPVKDPNPGLPGSSDQVVVLMVSLHCRGCERKMKKHLSKMPSVRSFSIEFAAKKVTVVGDVTPLQVLSSISKVKNAQLWNPSMSSSYTLKL